MNDWTPELEQAVVERLGQQPWVEFAYLFGSTARGTSRAASDYDIAVHAEGDACARLWQLLGILGAVLPAERLHIVLFEQASSLLKQRIFRDGRLLYEQDSRARKDYQVRVLREYCDFQPRREFFRKALKERLARHG